jgi:signal transduction histidine kinase
MKGNTLLEAAIKPLLAYARIGVLLAASIVLMMATFLLLSRNLATLNNAARWAAHTEQVRFQLAQVLQSLIDLGNGVYGYEVTHDPRELEPSLTAAAAIPGELSALEQMTANEAAERPLVAQLVALARQRQLQAQGQRERALRGDFTGVHAAISTGEGKRIMDSARLLVAQLQAAETRILELHNEKAQHAREVVAFLSVMRTALAIVFLITIAVVTVRQAERQRTLQDELARILREADQRKDVFLATLAHELRNPLAPIRTATRVLETPGITRAELEHSRLIISRQVRHMASLLDDLLDISRITRGVLILRKDQVDLRSALESAIETAQPAISAKRHVLRRELPDERITLQADPVRLCQIVANLLTNAAKYTDPDGEITLRVHRDAESIVISVRDTGIGIAPDMLPTVFDMFAQVDSARDHSEDGLGIGLALVKGFVELHGGRVEARSAGLEHGSEFIVYLPASITRSAAPMIPADPGVDGPQATGRSVLVADDNLDGAEIMAMLLTQSGYRVRIAHTGLEALALAAEEHPDVAILDIGMPGMDGYSVAQRMRSEAWGARICLIAVTGWGQEGDKRKAEEAGFDHHLTKPMDPERLERILSMRTA